MQLLTKKLNNIIGNDIAKQQLIKAFEQGNICGSWLITGPQNIGKSSLIRALLNIVYPDTHNIEEKILDKTLPNFLSIGDDQNKNITIDAIRDIGKLLNLTGANNGYKIVLIDNAELMNKYASNALLKILEEPPIDSVIFLVTHNLARLLPTIRSRCRIINMVPIKQQELKSYFSHNINPLLFAIAQGRIGLIKTLQQHNAEKMYEDILQILHTKQFNQVMALASNYELLTNHSRWLVFTVLIKYCISHMAKIVSNMYNVSGSIVEISKRYNALEWAKLYETVDKILHNTMMLNLDKKHSLTLIINLFR